MTITIRQYGRPLAQWWTIHSMDVGYYDVVLTSNPRDPNADVDSVIEVR
jgi:hypothetical protein